MLYCSHLLYMTIYFSTLYDENKNLENSYDDESFFVQLMPHLLKREANAKLCTVSFEVIYTNTIIKPIKAQATSMF